MFPYPRLIRSASFSLIAGACLCVNAQGISNYTQAEKIWQSAQQAYISGQPQSCYQQLEQLSDALIGEISYDRLLGLCASAAGEHEQALLAFERIMVQQPQNAEIRLERARTLYLLGQLKEAQDEFRFLASNDPPASALANIQNFLRMVEEALRPKLKVSTSLQVGLKAGHDSNANNASELQEFLGFSVSENSQSIDSPMYGANIALRHSRPIAERILLSFSTSLATKSFPDADFVDQDLGIVTAGLTQLGERTINRLDVFAYAQAVDSDLNSRGAFLRFAHTYRWKENMDVGGYYKAGALRYANNLRIKDVNQYAIGTTGRYKFASEKGQSLSYDLNIGRDYPVFGDSNFRRDTYNIRLDHSYAWSDVLSSKISASYFVYDFKSPFFAQVFPEPRDDEQLSALAELRWNVNEEWSLTPRIGYTDLSSSVDIYAYERFYSELDLSYRWNW